MADGLHRFLAATGLGAASLIAVAQSFGWEGGFAAAIYFVATRGDQRYPGAGYDGCDEC